MVFDQATHHVRVFCRSTKGDILIQVNPSWAPLGAARFLELVQAGFFSAAGGIELFRTVKNFIAQFGIAGDPAVHKLWISRGRIQDDPQWLDMKEKQRFKKGMISFAGGGENSRLTEMFIALTDVRLGGAPHEVPFGQVIQGLGVLDLWYDGYGDIPQFGGHAPLQGQMYSRGNEYLRAEFPSLDYITECRIVNSDVNLPSTLPNHPPLSLSPPLPSVNSSNGEVNVMSQ